MSLYRTYRPHTFDDVVGQDHIVSTLAKAMEQDQLSHAYLFAGVRGTGKTSTARILAKTLLTRGLQDETIKKQVLQAIDEGNLVDLIEIDAASNRGIDDIRSLIEKIQFTPVVASAKVYIIDEAHMLTKEAFNALLKTLEEPPSYAYFVLATTELHKIPATIQSRCQRFLFRQIDEKDLVSRLAYIAAEEKIQVEEGALAIIAHHVQGGMRDAISLLDQLRSLPAVTVEAVKERVGETGHEFVTDVFAALESGNRAEIVRIVTDLERTGVPLENFTRLLLGEVRKHLHEAVREKRNTTTIERRLDAFLQAAKDLRTAPVQGLVLEAALISLCGATAAEPLPAAAPPTPPMIATQPVRTDPQVTAPSPTLAPTPAQPSVTPASIPAPAVAPGGTPTISDVRKVWPSVIDKVQPASSRMSLKNGQIHAIENGMVIVRFSSGFHREKASTGEALHTTEKSLAEALGTKLGLKYVLDSEIHAPPPLPEEDQVDLAAAAMDVF